jgi:Xaa-Pro aminopeptidase
MSEDVKWPQIPHEEYHARIEKAKKLLAAHEIDALLLFSPTSWYYYGGWTDVAQMHNDIWRSAMIVCQDRDPVFVGHTAFQTCLSLTTYVEDVRCWNTESRHRYPNAFLPLFLDTIKDLGLSRGVLGIEAGPDIDTYLSFTEYDALRAGLPDAKIVGADKMIFEQRMIKTPYEIGLIREGCKRACEAVRTAFSAIRPGVNELEVHRVFWRAAVENGLVEAPYQGTWLCFSSNPREVGGVTRWITQAVDRVIEVGDQGICDCGPTYKKYQLDFQRNFFVGEPPAKQIKYYDIAKEAYFETVNAVRPGTRMCDIHQVSVEALQRRDPTQRHMISFVGHQEGLANHEPPWITADEQEVVQPGMIMAIEVGAFDPENEVCGGMPEDVLLVTNDGVENLTGDLSHDLWIVQ